MNNIVLLVGGDEGEEEAVDHSTGTSDRDEHER